MSWDVVTLLAILAIVIGSAGLGVLLGFVTGERLTARFLYREAVTSADPALLEFVESIASKKGR